MAFVVAVDDQPLWRDLHEQHLSAAGHDVRTYADGRVALASFACAAPDVVILDLGMYPSGRDMLKEVRRRLPGVPIIVFTAYGGYGSDPEISRADAFLVKSADFSALVAAVDRLVERRTDARP